MASGVERATTQIDGPQMTAKRVFDAPRELVFEAWSRPEHLAAWWGPNGFSITTASMEFRPGGSWVYTMHGPPGDFPNVMTYREITPPERIVYDHGDDQDPAIFKVTATFEERDGKTELTMRSVFRSEEELERVVREFGARQGAEETLERLAAWLASQSR